MDFLFRSIYQMNQTNHIDSKRRLSIFRILSILFSLLLIVFLAAIFSSSTNIDQHISTSNAIVVLFDKTYGTAEMSDIAPHTTGKFRDNKPKELWVIDTWEALTRIKYKRLSSNVIDSIIKGDKAVVILQSEIYTVGGEANQKEVFYLMKKEGIWKIDELVVTDEEVEARKEKI